MHPRTLSISDFTYQLPEERIAQLPLADRDASKLLVYNKGVIADHHFNELPDQLPKNTLLILNNTKVVNARVEFHRATGARIEILCLSPPSGKPVEQAFSEQGVSDWNCFIGNAKRWRSEEELSAEANGIRVTAKRTASEQVKFSWEPSDLTFAELLDKIGHVPLPPYMKRPDAQADKLRYNTVFAQHEGSVAAPTASLHFTNELLERFNQIGIYTTELTLHVGAGTFLPVKSDTMAEHAMHSEQIRIPRLAIKTVLQQLAIGPIIPVGTTAMRTLESIYWHGIKVMNGQATEEIEIDQWEPYKIPPSELPTAQEALDAVLRIVQDGSVLQGRTKLLIAPGYTFKLATGLVTNFHQPQSTLLLLVAALLGKNWRTVYDHALAYNYRFLSYGDGSLLLP